MSSWLARAGVAALGLALAATAGAVEQKPRPLPLKERCVTAAERNGAVRFLASDGTRLIGVQFGRGQKGVVLAHQGDYGDFCVWVPFARRLAALGHRVFVFDHRGFGSSASAKVRANASRVDLDVVGAVRELRRRGARSVVLAGASLGGTAVLAAAAQIQPAVQGVVSFGAPGVYEQVDATRAMPRLTVPALFVSAAEDGLFADDARALYAAAASADKRVVIVPGSVHGTPVLREPAVWMLFAEWVRSHSAAPGS